MPELIFKNPLSYRSGIEFCFLSGVYSSSIGFTKAFEDGKRLVGLSGIFIGVGEIVGMFTLIFFAASTSALFFKI